MARTSLMIAIFLSAGTPPLRMTVNSVCSSTAAAAGPAAAAAGAAAVTPNFSSIALMRSAISVIFISPIALRICSLVSAAILSSP